MLQFMASSIVLLLFLSLTTCLLGIGEPSEAAQRYVVVYGWSFLALGWLCHLTSSTLRQPHVAVQCDVSSQRWLSMYANVLTLTALYSTCNLCLSAFLYTFWGTVPWSLCWPSYASQGNCNSVSSSAHDLFTLLAWAASWPTVSLALRCQQCDLSQTFCQDRRYATCHNVFVQTSQPKS